MQRRAIRAAGAVATAAVVLIPLTLHAAQPGVSGHPTGCSCATCGIPQVNPTPAGPAGSGTFTTVPVPALTSNPSATVKLYLNFGGMAYAGTWGTTGKTPGNVPAYDIDGNTATFSQAELDNIYQVWARVSEAYAPFDIDVTTVDPGTPLYRSSARVVIGGNNNWLDGMSGGVAFIGGYATADYQRGTAWAFPTNLGFGDPKRVADAVTHEAGHLFGLAHQQLRAADGTLISSYRTAENDAITAPIMGTAYDRPRGTWSNGVIGWSNATSSLLYQNDIAQLASTVANPYIHPVYGVQYINDFGFRPDETGDTMATAVPLDMAGNVFSASGVISSNADSDMYSLDTWGGITRIEINNADFGAMLDIRFRLFNATGVLLANVNPALSTVGPDFGLDALWAGYLPAGRYYLSVSGAGGYGDVGSYSLQGSSISVLIPEPASAALLAPTVLLGLRRRRAA